MYLRPEESKPDLLYQGDVLKDFPFLVFEQDLKILRKIDGQFQLVTPDNSYVDGEEKVGLIAKLERVILLSQTCDIEHRSHVVVAPVYSFTKIEGLPGGQAGLVKKRKGMNFFFYLPEYTGIIEESYADFQLIHYVPKSFIEKYRSNKILSMSDWGRHHLGWALANYFGRPIEKK